MTDFKLDSQELDYYVKCYKKSTFQAPLNWYRTRRINHIEETEANLPSKLPSSLPCLLLPAELDAALPLKMSEKVKEKYFPDGNLEIRILRGADHWVSACIAYIVMLLY